MTNEEAIANYKYDRAIALIRRIKTEETHEREIDRHKAFDLAISALEKQIPKKPHIHIMLYKNGERREIEQCPYCHDSAEYGLWDTLVDKGVNHCHRCGQAIDWSDEQ